MRDDIFIVSFYLRASYDGDQLEVCEKFGVPHQYETSLTLQHYIFDVLYVLKREAKKSANLLQIMR